MRNSFNSMFKTREINETKVELTLEELKIQEDVHKEKRCAFNANFSNTKFSKQLRGE